MSKLLDNAIRWQAEASELLLDTPDPCTNIDRVLTIVNAQSICLDNLIAAVGQLSDVLEEHRNSNDSHTRLI